MSDALKAFALQEDTFAVSVIAGTAGDGLAEKETSSSQGIIDAAFKVLEPETAGGIRPLDQRVG